MRNRFTSGLLALGAVSTLVIASPVPTASAAESIGDQVCDMYANATGFGAACHGGQITWAAPAAAAVPVEGQPAPPPPPPPPTWQDRLGGEPFIPCRDFDVPAGITLPEPPDGKEWVQRMTIEDYDLNTWNGGDDAHLERAIVPVSDAEREQCRTPEYMEQFWTRFDEAYPDPVLLVKPTYTPRVNVPAYFALAPETSYILKNYGAVEDRNIAGYQPGERLTMRAMVTRLTVDPGDGTKPFECLGGTVPIGSDGYDESADPFTQASTCSHVYKRSSANQPDGMYEVKLTIHWQVDYWRGGLPDEWNPVGEADVNAIQKLPVQEVQAIGG